MKKAKKPISTRLWGYQLQVSGEAGRTIADPLDAKRWLKQPCPQLGGRAPLRVATTKRGTARVLRVLKYWPGPEEGLAHLSRLPPVPIFGSKADRIKWYRVQMIHAAERCLESQAAAKAWVLSPAFALQGRVPWRVCVSRKGLQECVTALRRIDLNIAS